MLFCVYRQGGTRESIFEHRQLEDRQNELNFRRSRLESEPKMEPPPTPPRVLPQTADKGTLKVHLPNGTFNVVRFGDAADIKGIIQLLTSRLGIKERYYQNLFAMRLFNSSTGDAYWFHQDTTMAQVQEKSQELSGDDILWQFELRIRYNPSDLTDLYDKEKVTFGCYYDQVRTATKSYCIFCYARVVSSFFFFFCNVTVDFYSLKLLFLTGPRRLSQQKLRVIRHGDGHPTLLSGNSTVFPGDATHRVGQEIKL